MKIIASLPLVLFAAECRAAHFRGGDFIARHHFPGVIEFPSLRNLEEYRRKKDKGENQDDTTDESPGSGPPYQSVDDIFIFPQWGEPGRSKCADSAYQFVFFVDRGTDPSITCKQGRDFIEPAMDARSFRRVKLADTLRDDGRSYEYFNFDNYLQSVWQSNTYIVENYAYDVKGFWGENYAKLSLMRYAKQPDSCGGVSATWFAEYLIYCDGDDGKISEYHTWRDQLGNAELEAFVENLNNVCIPFLQENKIYPRTDLATCYDN